MITQAIHESDVEQDRQQLLEELSAENDPNWAEQFQPGSFGCHELLDRTMMAAAIVERYVLTHPGCALNPNWYALAEQAMSALNALYQSVGAAHGDAPNQFGK